MVKFSRTIRKTAELEKLCNTNFIIQETCLITDLHFSRAFQMTCFKYVVIKRGDLILTHLKCHFP